MHKFSAMDMFSTIKHKINGHDNNTILVKMCLEI